MSSQLGLPTGYTDEIQILPIHTIIRTPSIIFPVLTAIFVGMRFYVRRYIVGGVGPDDWLALLCLILFSGSAGMVLWGSTIGFGMHESDIEPSLLPQLREIMTIFPIIAQLGFMFIQLSLLVFYRRLSPSQRFHNLCSILMGLAILISVSRVVFTFIWCYHIKPGPRFCPGLRHVNFGYTVVGICLNSIIWCMPIPMLWRLRICVRKRLGLIGLFSVGFIAVAATIARVIIMKTLDMSDPPWVTPWISLMCQIEISVGIICACLPTLPPLLTQTSWFRFTQKTSPVVNIHELEQGGDSGGGTELADRARVGWEGVSLTRTWQGVQRYYHTRWGRKRSIIDVVDLEGFGVLDPYKENPMHPQLPPIPIPANHGQAVFGSDISPKVHTPIPFVSPQTGSPKALCDLRSGESAEVLLSANTPRTGNSDQLTLSTGKTDTTTSLSA